MRTQIVSAVVTAALLVASLTARADVKSMIIGVDGVICTSCAFTLDRGLHKVEGVASTQLVVKSPVHIEIACKPRFWLDPGRVVRQIDASGFSARRDEVLITLTGTVVRDGDRLTMRVDDISTPVSIELEQAAGAAAKDADATAWAAAQAGAGRLVRIEAWWREAAKGTIAHLALKRVLTVQPDAAALPTSSSR